MRHAVDEICEGGHGSGQADGRAVEPDDKDLRVCGEGVAEVEVVGDEVVQPVVVLGDGLFRALAADGNIGAPRLREFVLARSETRLVQMVRVDLYCGGTYAEKYLPLPMRTVTNTSS